MDLASLLQGSPSQVYTDTYGKRSAPLSLPAKELRCSLPSISTLLQGADRHAAKRQRLSPQRDHAVQYDIRMPPTPPLRPGSGTGDASSSSKDHQSSTFTINSNSHMGPYASPAPSVSSYSSHTSQVEAQSPTTIMYRRPPSITTFALSTIHRPAQSPSLISPVTRAWQHHHYLPPSSTTPYQQKHDRYIYRTCHKAFSRPSSLRVHSHSHTGEKPFRYTHTGCGKPFSVRSNMMRHDRGCHSGRPIAATVLVV